MSCLEALDRKLEFYMKNYAHSQLEIAVGQSVSEHINRVTYIGYVLGMLEKDVSVEKILKMCMFHDVAEGRVSDLNYVHQKYVKRQEDLAVEDLTEKLPFGKDMANSS